MADFRNGGFTPFAEKVNGRVAQIAFPLGLMDTFNGDLLDQLAAHPIQVKLLVPRHPDRCGGPPARCR